MSETPELLPCPFCGREAEYKIYGEENEYDQVKCKKCGFWFDAPKYDVSSREIWNRRVPAEPQWTKGIPKKEGFYWIETYRTIEIVRVVIKRRAHVYKIGTSKEMSIYAMDGAYWSYIEFPDMPKEMKDRFYEELK